MLVLTKEREGQNKERNKKGQSKKSKPFDLSHFRYATEGIQKHRSIYRESLINTGRIQRIADTKEHWELTAVDSASLEMPLPGGINLLISGVYSNLNRALLSENKVYQFANGFYKESFMALGRLATELYLLSEAPLILNTYVIFDYSLSGLLIQINNILYDLEKYEQEVTNPSHDRMAQDWRYLWESSFGELGRFHKVMREYRVLGITKEPTSRTMVQSFQKFLVEQGESDSIIQAISTLNDAGLLRSIMEPGEYITPVQSVLWEQDRKYNRGIIRKHNDTSRKQIEDTYQLNPIMHTYFLPWRGAKVHRIEYNQANQIQNILNTVNYYCNQEVQEVLQQAVADQLAKSNLNALLQQFNNEVSLLVKNSPNLEYSKTYYHLLTAQRS